MGDAAEVIDALKCIGFGMAFTGEPSARARVWDNAARTLKKFPNLRKAWEDGELKGLKGIGRGILDVVDRVFRDEEVPALQELVAKIPAGLLEARKIRGVGPMKLKAMHEALGVTTVGEIEYACNENRLVALKGFGEKTQAKILVSIAALRATTTGARLDVGTEGAESELKRLAGIAGVEAVRLAGAVRRAEEVIEAIELVAHVPDAARASLMAEVEGKLEDADGVTTLHYQSALPVRVALCEFGDDLGALQWWQTGSAAHRDAVVAHAKTVGATLGPLGLYVDGDNVACPDEATLYSALKLLPTPPERREADVPLVHQGSAAPRLVARADLRGALHNHTTESDGVHSLADMQRQADALGLEYLGISEHSQSAGYAGGLDPTRLASQVAAIAKLNAANPDGCVVLSGVESDILKEGELDYESAELAALDVVVASVHRRFKLDRDGFTKRMVAAAQNPYTDIIGHPTGRLILGRAPSDFDVIAMLDACAASGTAVELNANPQRLDLSAEHLVLAKERGLKVSISADAHSMHALDHLDWGIATARRAGLTPDDVLNCLPLAGLREWLSARRERAGV